MLSLAELRDRAEQVSAHLALLSNASRLLILCHLLDGERTVGALQAELEIGQSALSQHLAKLREAGLVATRREAQTIHYRIADPRLKDLLETLYQIYCVPDADRPG